MKKILIIVLVAATGGTIFYVFSQGETNSRQAALSAGIPTHTVERGDLSVTVSAGGTIQAMHTTKVDGNVEGQTKILEIVEEGTILTKEDVENDKIIVRLDSSSMEDKAEQQELDLANAKAAFKNAEENLNIQKQQNESDISQAELAVNFARMDLEKYVGKELASRIVERNIDYENIGNHEQLGGEAEVKKSNLESEISLAEEELTRAEDTLKWTTKLVEKGYVNRNEQDADELQLKTRKSNLRQARANLRLFLTYTLPKNVEQYASDFKEAKRELERVKARARGQLAQAQSQFETKKATYEMKKERLEELKTMIDNCTIEAPEPGLVVYASTSGGRRHRDDPIEEGRQLRQGETIITIPDLETMVAEVDITEGDIKSVEKGQKADVSVEAIADKTWEGQVEKVSSMASSQRRFGPDIRVYDTMVKLSGRVTDLKPGMTTTAEIYVADLKDVLTVPVQAVTTYRGNRAIWTKNSDKIRLHQVRTGHFSDTRVEIREGLSPGDKVLLAKPDMAPDDAEFVALSSNPRDNRNRQKVINESKRGKSGASRQADQ